MRLHNGSQREREREREVERHESAEVSSYIAIIAFDKH